MSFQIAVEPNNRAAARFVGKVRRVLVSLLADHPDVSRKQVADAIGVHRSVITRQLNGHADISVGRIAEIAWALGYRPVIEFEKIGGADGCNLPTAVAPAYRAVVVQSSQTSSNEVMNLSGPSPVQQTFKSIALAI